MFQKLLGDNGKDKEMQQQIRILATNLEILNQKLNQNPDAALNPTEAALKEKVDELGQNLEYVKNVLKTNQNNPEGLREQKDMLQAEISRLNQVTQNMNGLDKNWLKSLNQHVNSFNTAAQTLSQDMNNTAQNMHHILESQKAEITKRIYLRLFRSLKKDNLIMMVFTCLLSSTMALAALFITLLYVVK
jgi:chromosome segregation ATPase